MKSFYKGALRFLRFVRWPLRSSTAFFVMDVRLARLLISLILRPLCLPRRWKCWYTLLFSSSGSMAVVFFSMAFESALFHVMVQSFCHDTAVDTLARRAAMWDRGNWQWRFETFLSVWADMLFFHCREELPYLQSFVAVMPSAAKNRSFHDGQRESPRSY